MSVHSYIPYHRTQYIYKSTKYIFLHLPFHFRNIIIVIVNIFVRLSVFFVFFLCFILRYFTLFLYEIGLMVLWFLFWRFRFTKKKNITDFSWLLLFKSYQILRVSCVYIHTQDKSKSKSKKKLFKGVLFRNV